MVIDRLKLAEAIHRALQMVANGLEDEDAMEIASVYPEWAVGRLYRAGDIITCGTNKVGDPQLYRVIQTHTSQADWMPDLVPALYKAIGITEDGTPEWSQPTGAHDAYNKGDVVMFEGKKWRSLIDGNVWSPAAYPQGWEVVND